MSNLEQTWKSPRQIEEEIKEYKRTRFEYYMSEVDNGRLTRELAIAALGEELSHVVKLDPLESV